MKKGFTLVELLAVLIVIGVIMLVTVPNIVNSINKGKTNKYNAFIKDLEMATENYVETNFEKYPQLTIVGNQTAVELNELVENNYLKEPIINPSNNNEMNLNSIVIVTVENDKSLSYQYSSNEYGKSSYITSDLKFWYDGYDKIVNLTWKDKTLNNNHGLVNGGSIINYGWQNNESSIDTTEAVSLGANFTYEIVIDNVTSIGNSTLSGLISNQSGTGGFVLGLGGTISSPQIKIMASTVQTDMQSIAKISVPKFITLVGNGTSLILYVNGVQEGSPFATAKTLASVQNVITIGKYSTSTQSVNGDYHSIRVYDRALTATEISKNYNIDRLRYGD